MSGTDTSTRITQVGTVMVPVGDQNRSIEFFTGKLGFEKRADIPFGEGERWVEVGPRGAATGIALVPPRTGERTGIETRVAFTTSDVVADHADLRGRGVEADVEITDPGAPTPPMFFFRDPDGNRFLVVERG